MTGFGRGLADGVGGRVAIEVRSVNHRFLDLKLRGVPSAALEDLIGQRVRERVERGAVTVAMRVERAAGAATAQLDGAAARRVHADLAALAADLGLAPPTLADILAVPGVLADAAPADAADLAEPTGRALGLALDELVTHRAAEGRALAADLAARLATLRALLDGLAAAAVDAGPTIAARLRERIARLLGADGALAPERLAQEVAVLVDRADVTEELVRARTHVDAIAAALAAPTGPVGRRLDFLLQEFGREINTTGAKSATAAISSQVVQAKAELEKMREQVQNLE